MSSSPTLLNFVAYGRYLQQLKDDPSLRKRMGEQGRTAVQTRTIENVVKDLLQWYKDGGIERRKRRSVINKFLCSLLLVVMVVVTVLLFFLYEKILVSIHVYIYIILFTHSHSLYLLLMLRLSAF